MRRVCLPTSIMNRACPDVSARYETCSDAWGSLAILDGHMFGLQGYVDLETKGNTLMVAGSPKYAEVIEATAKRFKDRPERERRRSPSPRSVACSRWCPAVV